MNDQPRHPGIAAALASGAEGRVAYLAQEFVAGDALDASLRQYGPPPLDAVLVTLGGLAEALDRAAGEGIHHGCLHPRDVIVSAGGEAHVIDLGVAEALQKAGLRAPVRRPYSAPERLGGKSWGGPADIFALGAIAYELVTGRRVPGPGVPPVASEGMTGLDQAALADVLGRALAVDPAARFASASDLVDVLRPVLARTRRVSLARRRAKAAPEGLVPLPLERDNAGIAASKAAEDPLAVTVASEPSLHDAADLPLTIADARSPGVTLAAAPAPRARPVPEAEPEAGAPAGARILQGPTWRGETRESSARSSLAPLLVALVLGVAAGFGLGYWAAWRAFVREQATSARAQPAPEQTSVARIDEPQVKPEAAPQPSAPQAAAPRPQPAAPEAAPTAPPERPRPRVERTPPGKLLIRSTPPGARVAIDGRARGRTPLILRDLPLRVMTVTVTEQGYKSSEERVALSAAKPTATVDARLTVETPEPPAGATTGSLLIESRPSNAQVFVDNRNIGMTPISLPELTPGFHRVRLELEGFTPWVTMAEVRAGARTRVSASLEQGTQQ